MLLNALQTNVLYLKCLKLGTSVRETLEKSVRHGEVLEMMYLAADGTVSKRRIKVHQVGEVSFRAYFYYRQRFSTCPCD